MKRLMRLALPWMIAALLLPLACNKKPAMDDVPPPAAGTTRIDTSGVRIDVPTEWEVTQAEHSVMLGPSQTEITIHTDVTDAKIEITIMKYRAPDQDDDLLETFSLMYTALHRGNDMEPMEIDTQAGTAIGGQLDVLPGPLSGGGALHRFWIIHPQARTVMVHEELPRGEAGVAVGKRTAAVVGSVGKSAGFMPGEG